MLARQWGVRLQYVYTGYDGLYDALAANQFDLILSALPYNPSKTQDVLFSHSYFNGGPVLVARESEQGIKIFADLAGRSVAVELGTSGDDFVRHWERRLRLNRQTFDTAGEVFAAVARGQVNAAVVDPISFYDYDRSNPGLEMIGGPLANEYYLIAVRRNSPTLLQQVNAVIDGARRDGSLKQLQARWF
jgi:polar amino acid transport system substrate-binding protein